MGIDVFERARRGGGGATRGRPAGGTSTSLSTDVKINGLAELQKALDTLPEKIQTNIMRGALRAGAKVIASDAKGTAAFVDRTGALRESIRVTTSVRGGIAKASVVSGPSKTNPVPFYARFVEYGTKAHIIKAKAGKLLAIGVSQVLHPGAKKHAFMRPAFDGKAQAAIEASREYVRARLLKKHGIDIPAPIVEGDQ